MVKVVILGIDGMDRQQIEKYIEFLPNLKKISINSPNINFKSIFPPDSIPAWGSLYTGLNPAQHGVVNFVDPINEDLKIKFNEIHEFYRGKTFWDQACRAGKKVCILLPYSIYPPWPVNGAMVCRTLELVSSDFPLNTYPTALFKEFHLSEFCINLFHGFPSKRQLKAFFHLCWNRTEQEGKLASRFLSRYEADLYFVYFSALDAIEHVFWNYCDDTSPEFLRENEYQDYIKNFYCLIDSIIGGIAYSLDESTYLIVLSDHGHGPRPTQLVNVNEILRRKGHLHVKRGSYHRQNLLYNKEKIKKIASKFIEIFGLGTAGMKYIERFPFLKKIVASANYIDFERTSAYLSAISAMKSYSEGGIIIRHTHEDRYESTRDLIIAELSESVHPETNEKLFEWVSRNEDLYQGPYLNKYPDIVFELKKGYGVGWNIDKPVIGKSGMAALQPGSHKRDSPVLFIYKKDGILDEMEGKTCELMDVGKLILHLLDE